MNRTPHTYTLPSLAYDYAALEPHIDAKTMEVHLTKHHQAYVDNLNKALASVDLGFDVPECVCDLIRDLDRVPPSIRAAVRNNGGGCANHSFFWKLLSPTPGPAPEAHSPLGQALSQTFGGLDAFKAQFEQAALGRFGSGWAWLVCRKDGTLVITSTPNQDNPWMEGGQVETPGYPLLGVDVWEHAYYLKYQNRRADYLKAFWNVLDWSLVAQRYARALGA
jgi:Fe-Mn family superoxide dismutase